MCNPYTWEETSLVFPIDPGCNCTYYDFAQYEYGGGAATCCFVNETNNQYQCASVASATSRTMSISITKSQSITPSVSMTQVTATRTPSSSNPFKQCQQGYVYDPTYNVCCPDDSTYNAANHSCCPNDADHVYNPGSDYLYCICYNPPRYCDVPYTLPIATFTLSRTPTPSLMISNVVTCPCCNLVLNPGQGTCCPVNQKNYFPTYGVCCPDGYSYNATSQLCYSCPDNCIYKNPISAMPTVASPTPSRTPSVRPSPSVSASKGSNCLYTNSSCCSYSCNIYYTPQFVCCTVYGASCECCMETDGTDCTVVPISTNSISGSNSPSKSVSGSISISSSVSATMGSMSAKPSKSTGSSPLVSRSVTPSAGSNCYQGNASCCFYNCAAAEPYYCCTPSSTTCLCCDPNSPNPNCITVPVKASPTPSISQSVSQSGNVGRCPSGYIYCSSLDLCCTRTECSGVCVLPFSSTPLPSKATETASFSISITGSISVSSSITGSKTATKSVTPSISMSNPGGTSRSNSKSESLSKTASTTPLRISVTPSPSALAILCPAPNTTIIMHKEMENYIVQQMEQNDRQRYEITKNPRDALPYLAGDDPWSLQRDNGTVIPFTSYGNWCGPGHGGFQDCCNGQQCSGCILPGGVVTRECLQQCPPVDQIDATCMNHDSCVFQNLPVSTTPSCGGVSQNYCPCDCYLAYRANSLYANNYCNRQQDQLYCSIYLYLLINLFECGSVTCFYNTNEIIGYYGSKTIYKQECSYQIPGGKYFNCIAGEWTP